MKMLIFLSSTLNLDSSHYRRPQGVQCSGKATTVLLGHYGIVSMDHLLPDKEQRK